MHALIIEDEPLIALVIEDCLRQRGVLSVEVAATEAEAVRSATQLCPDLITADVRLAHGCGIAAVRAICSARSISVLFITATPADLANRLPGAAVLSKPFTMNGLNEALLAVCGSAFGPTD